MKKMEEHLGIRFISKSSAGKAMASFSGLQAKVEP